MLEETFTEAHFTYIQVQALKPNTVGALPLLGHGTLLILISINVAFHYPDVY